MSLCSDPPACTFSATGGTSTHKLITGGTDRLVFKVKCSNNQDYRITPVFGFVEPGVPRDIIIQRSQGPPKEDKLSVQYAIAHPNSEDAQAAFSNLTPIGSFTIPLTASPP